MNGNYTIQANFVPKYVLNVSSGTGGSVTTPSEATSSYCQGIVVPLVATPDLGWAFVNWTPNTGTMGNASAASTTITMNGNYTITANFVFVGTYWLMVNTTAGGHIGQPPGGGNTTQTVGAIVNLVAVPDAGCFGNWTGGPVANASAASTTITMNGNYTIQANFVAKYTLTINSSSGGTVTTPAGVPPFTYCPGIVVNLVATASTGYNFVNWTLGPVVNPTAASTTITMNNNYSIQANFQAVATPTPTPTTQGSSGGSGGVATPTPTPTRTPTPTGPTPTSTALPTVPPIPTATPISIPGNGTVSQDIVYSVLSGQAVLTIPKGTIALTAAGGPLQSISVEEICFGYPPDPKIIGCVYDYKPTGATFSPPITLTLKYDPGMLPAGFDASKLVIAFYNTATSKWEVVPGSVVDTAKHTVTVQISHFTMFAVYAAAPAVTPTPRPTVAPTPTPTPAAGGGLSGGVIALIVILVVIVIGLAGYWFLKKRRKPPAPSTPTTGPTAGPTAGPKKT
jgi:hypothetical protein